MHQRTLRNIKKEWLVRLQGAGLYCALCGCLIEARKDLTADHKTPRSAGGATDESNLLPSHHCCNQAKADKSYEDWQENGYKYLKALIKAWDKNGKKYNHEKVQKCLKALKVKQYG